MSLRTDWSNGESVDADDLNAIGTEVNANTSGVAGKADKSVTVTAGTGLSGGGDLSANRTLAVAYGTSAGTACAGNDSRLSDTRAPTDNTVTFAKLNSSLVADEDNMSSDSATKIPTQQSVKAYVDAKAPHVGTSPPSDTTRLWVDTN